MDHLKNVPNRLQIVQKRLGGAWGVSGASWGRLRAGFGRLEGVLEASVGRLGARGFAFLRIHYETGAKTHIVCQRSS